MVIAAEKHRTNAKRGEARRFPGIPLSSAARVYPGAPWMVQNPSLLPDTPIPRHRDLGSCLDVDRCSLIIERSAGSVVDVVANGSGNTILDHIVYDSFGNTVSQTNASNAMLMGYQGYILDSITGLYYANARYYSPSLGRFISQDPSGFSAGDANLYRFVGNHPTYSVDPTGLYEGGSAFTQGTGNSGFGSTSVGSSVINLTPDQWNAASQIVNNATGSGSWSNAIPGSGSTPQTNASAFWTSGAGSNSPFGGQGSITAPTSVGTSSGFGGSGSYSSGNNSVSFNLGAGPSNQGLSALAPSVYDSMGGGGGVSFASNIPSAASSAAYMQNLSASYPSVINNALNRDMGGIIQAAQELNPLSSAMGSLGGALSSWGQAQASAGNAGWGATGMFLGGVANTAAGLGNPVSSLLSLSSQSYNVAYRDGTAAGIGYGVGSLIGATQLTQAIMGENFATGQSLVGLNRWGMAFQGVSAASGTAALGAGAWSSDAAAESTLATSPVNWVEETTGMSSRAEDYGAGATGARSNLISQYREVPQLGYSRADGSLQMVRFDGYEGGVLIDRKLGVVDSPRGYEEALRQSTALQEHGLTGRWEVPNATEAAIARKMFNNVGITNISVKVVPP